MRFGRPAQTRRTPTAEQETLHPVDALKQLEERTFALKCLLWAIEDAADEHGDQWADQFAMLPDAPDRMLIRLLSELHRESDDALTAAKNWWEKHGRQMLADSEALRDSRAAEDLTAAGGTR